MRKCLIAVVLASAAMVVIGCGSSSWEDLYGDQALVAVIVQGEGTVTRSPEGQFHDEHYYEYKDGDTVTLTATPRAGYAFESWRNGEGEFLSDQPIMTVTLHIGPNIFGAFFR